LEHYFTNNQNLKSELRTIIYKYQDESLVFYSDNGVFSKDKLDFGSSLLLETYFEKNKKKNLRLLDVGCGYGFLGISIAKILGYQVTMCDVNKRALHLASKNLLENNVEAEVIESNVYENITGNYDVIITNPPIRAGKEIVYQILDEAKDHLTDAGELWFVIRKDQGAKSTLKHLENNYLCEIIAKSKGFYIIKAKNR
jgi:16S rRNA (guanine1207-N2)-methyltransferase